ncbi:hypothetical protein [Micrococcus sp. HOU01]|uniref:hypothetical protein n=1 Tax=Micrococcus sp. HOU01 TaxID=3101753 RepID=UPI002D77FC80|nr:hypothetical protein [Micrococcus sp. HOU1]WRQ42658.1 hypothetical protein SOY78_06350 [Micrococcus sp. HOU1]
MTTSTEPWARVIRVVRDDTVRLVRIVTATDQDYEVAVAEADAAGGSVDAVAAYLAQWDRGSEADDEAALWPEEMPTAAELGRLQHQLHCARAGGLDYWLLIDHQIGLYALYRAPLNREETTA